MRVMMWQGVSKLVSPHTPLLFPDHAPDSVNLIRPLIGYGFDTLRLTYEGYYNPEMFALEARDIVFDRSHNEFWDTLAFTGILGLIAKYGFFLAIIYYALKWIGFIKSVRERKLYWGLTLIGGALGALGLTLSMGIAFLGIGLPAGLLAGSVGILIYRIFRPLSNSEMPLKPWQAITVVSIFSAIISHYVETLFSFSVVSTLTLLWILPALLVVTGWIVPMAHEQVDAGEATEILGRRTELQHVGINAGLVISIMLVLAMDFISNYQTNVDASTILETSLTVISRPAPHTSYGIFWLLMGTLFVSSIILQLEEASLHTQRFNGPSLLFTLGIALFISALAWMLRANQLAALKEISPLYLETYAANLFWRTKAFYIGLLLTAFTWGVAFKPNGVSRRAPQKLINILGYIAFPIGAIVLSAILNLRPIQADVIYINAKGQLNTGQHKIALALFDKALELSPYEGIYLTDAASAYIAYSDLMPDPMQKQALLQRALSYAQKAYNLSPLFVERTINLARINKMMGAMMQDDGQRSARYYLANSFYASALSIKPTRPDYWMEWANLLIQIGDTKGAREKIDKAIAVDNTYEPPYEVSAQLYMTEANGQANPEVRVKLFEKAIQTYQDEAELLVRRGGNPAFVLVEIGKIQENLQRYEEARTTVSQIAELGIGEYQWEIYKKLAELSDMLNDVAAQREYLKQAIAIAPAQEVQSLQAELDLLKP
jgi:tetratricopeptide (TPR) repeat protein